MDLDDNLNDSTIKFPLTSGHNIPFSLEDDTLTSGENYRVLIVDDNTDMR
jgi:hypothetical protein